LSRASRKYSKGWRISSCPQCNGRAQETARRLNDTQKSCSDPSEPKSSEAPGGFCVSQLFARWQREWLSLVGFSCSDWEPRRGGSALILLSH
jgi:hypothetical protein